MDKNYRILFQTAIVCMVVTVVVAIIKENPVPISEKKREDACKLATSIFSGATKDTKHKAAKICIEENLK